MKKLQWILLLILVGVTAMNGIWTLRARKTVAEKSGNVGAGLTFYNSSWGEPYGILRSVCLDSERAPKYASLTAIVEERRRALKDAENALSLYQQFVAGKNPNEQVVLAPDGKSLLVYGRLR